MARFSNKSKANLEGVHPDLVRVFNRAIEITKQDFSITKSVRTKSEQKRLVAQGKSQTMNSKHLVQADGYSHAIDVVDYPITWNLERFYPIAEAVRTASKELGVTVRWGGAWINLNSTTKPTKQLVEEYISARKRAGNKVFIDAVHFELVK